jgi:exodeoxyribonuclease VII small subunit
VNRKNPPADSDDQRRDAPAGAADAQSNLPLGADPASGAEQTGPADFERSLAELEAIVEKLERGDLSLEDSLQCFERGVQLTRACQTALRQAEHKVEILMRRSGGAGDEFETTPFEPSNNDRGA